MQRLGRRTETGSPPTSGWQHFTPELLNHQENWTRTPAWLESSETRPMTSISPPTTTTTTRCLTGAFYSDSPQYSRVYTGYHGAVGGVNAVKRANIIQDLFFFFFAVQVQLRPLAVTVLCFFPADCCRQSPEFVNRRNRRPSPSSQANQEVMRLKTFEPLSQSKPSSLSRHRQLLASARRPSNGRSHSSSVEAATLKNPLKSAVLGGAVLPPLTGQ